MTEERSTPSNRSPGRPTTWRQAWGACECSRSTRSRSGATSGGAC